MNSNQLKASDHNSKSAFFRGNLPIIILITGVVLILFMLSGSVGLLAYVWMNRPTSEEQIQSVDLSRYNSTLPEEITSSENVEIVEGSAPGLYKVETESIVEVQEISPAGSVLPGGQTFTSSSVLPELPTSYYENRLKQKLTNSNEAPTLSHQGGDERGPQRVQFIISETGTYHDHSLGEASIIKTDTVGAAGEWQVRPWWRPAWVPQTVDCGEEGTVAIGGHVSWARRPGPFHDLGAMTSGDRIRCQSQDGDWFTYEVSEVVQVGYNDTDYYWSTRSNLNSKQLTLFTCKPEITGIIVVRAQIISG
ncbi:MAG: class F sortase [Chloroflexota bacterium]